MTDDPFNPYDEPREPSPGEIEVEHGSLLLMLFRALKVPMPKKEDEAAIERAGVLLTRRFPWLARITRKQKQPPTAPKKG
jgi:hypothetical protein